MGVCQMEALLVENDTGHQTEGFAVEEWAKVVQQGNVVKILVGCLHLHQINLQERFMSVLNRALY